MTITEYIEFKIRHQLLAALTKSRKTLEYINSQTVDYIGQYLLYCYINTKLPYHTLPVTRDNQQIITELLTELFFKECGSLAKK